MQGKQCIEATECLVYTSLLICALVLGCVFGGKQDLELSASLQQRTNIVFTIRNNSADTIWIQHADMLEDVIQLYAANSDMLDVSVWKPELEPTDLVPYQRLRFLLDIPPGGQVQQQVSLSIKWRHPSESRATCVWTFPIYHEDGRTKALVKGETILRQ